MKTDHLRFAHGLLTPRLDIAEREVGLRRSDLLQSQRLKRIEAVYKSSEKKFVDSVEAADEVGHMVRQTLLFGSMAVTDGRLWNFDERTDAVQTNCFGHTIIASEILDAVDVPHFVSMANGHSFITLFEEETRYGHMVDPPSKDLFVDLDGMSVMGNCPATVLKDETVNACINMLNTADILANVRRYTSSDMLLRHPWMSHLNALAVNTNVDDESIAQTLIMKTYRPEQGRAMLLNYGMSMQYINQNQLGSALDMFRKLEGFYPDVDRRNNLKLASKVRDALGHAGWILEMEDIGRVVDTSLAKSGPAQDTTANQYFLLDTARRMAYLSGSAEALDTVAEQYDATADTLLAKGKSGRARMLAAIVRDMCGN